MYFSHPWPLLEFPSWNRRSFTNCLSGLPENQRDNPDCKKMDAVDRGEGRMADPTALDALFACYYVFNLEYQVEASTTLEFVQRFLVRINPDSNKCTAKEQMSKTTGRVVKRKTSYMNPHVISFIRDFTEFYLLTD